MRLFIPAIGDRLTLSSAWDFTLYDEHRNLQFGKALGVVAKDAKRNWGAELRKIPASLPAGTVLECDRVYVRTFNKSRVQLQNDYDSVTWKVIGPKGKPLPGQRFWVKLPDCHAIDYDPESVVQYRDRVKLAQLVMEG